MWQNVNKFLFAKHGIKNKVRHGIKYTFSNAMFALNKIVQNHVAYKYLSNALCQ